MCPDSVNSEQFVLGKTKLAYSITHSFAPYFYMLCRQTKGCKFITVLFDETLNDLVQEIQMDICIWFWNVNLNEVSTHCLNSCFLSHATANDIYLNFQRCLEKHCYQSYYRYQ